ncbi:glycoside hydrolase [Desulfuromonas soudanensis]|uniref:Glycoside hydrolase n=1 Tax=Desulfuromonas soudanensis TaxID=1603606 RepID=A0A0M5IZD0_9BACT|nr:GPMC system family 4 glycosyltransferase [Desulfuromonas soudanensis]ALC17118.1 glycoside hydrolase [Desulfuromonas soudanensis]
MRILIVLPRQDPATGNEVTAARHRAGLEALGHEVALERVAPGDGASLRAATLSFAPDVIHLLHAYRSGRPWLEARVDGIPCVVTLTGTDIHGGLDDPAEGPVIRRVLEKADRIITQNRLTAEALNQAGPPFAGKIVCLPPGIVLGTAPSPFARSDLSPPGHPLFLHPAGIRPVKGNLELLELFDPLAASGLPFAVAFCGPPLDAPYSADFFAAVARRPWARHLGVIPPKAMPALLREADVVLNNSQKEGLPNALLEAAALGVPMLVRNIPGNAAVVQEGVNGFLYGDAAAFADRAGKLIADPALRRALSRPSPERYAPEKETEVLLAFYRQAIAESCDSQAAVHD